MSEPDINSIPVPENEQLQHQASPASAGARLAACREAHGWTVEQVASQLNLAPRQIVAIERDEFSALPGMPIVRGFVRSYAKLLKMDPVPLLALVGGDTVSVHEPLEPHKSLAAPFLETRLPSMSDRPGLSSKWVIGGLVIVLLGVGLWAAQLAPDVGSLQKSASDQVKGGIAYLSGSDAGKPADEKQAVPVQPDSQQAASAAMLAPAADTPKDEITKTTSDAVKADEPVKPLGDAAKPPILTAPATTSPASSKVQETNAKTVATKDALTFNAREDSWIEVRRSSDKSVLLSRVVKAGTSESVEVGEPVSVIVGNAAGVDASLRGEPVELKSAGGNVARLSLK